MHLSTPTGNNTDQAEQPAVGGKYRDLSCSCFFFFKYDGKYCLESDLIRISRRLDLAV